MDPSFAEQLPPRLLPYAEAIAIVDAVPDADSAEWWPAGHPTGLRVPFEPHHHHPAVRGIHWDGVVPTYPCARLDLHHASVTDLADAIRMEGADHLGADGALYAFGFSHRSQHRCRIEALDQLAAIVDRASTLRDR